MLLDDVDMQELTLIKIVPEVLEFVNREDITESQLVFVIGEGETEEKISTFNWAQMNLPFIKLLLTHDELRN